MDCLYRYFIQKKSESSDLFILLSYPASAIMVWQPRKIQNLFACHKLWTQDKFI